MAGKHKVQPVSRVGLDPLVAIAEHLRAGLPGWEDATTTVIRPPAPSDLAQDLAYLALHDADGFLTASIGEDVVGIATAYMRSRQLVLSQLWLLPEAAGENLAELLLRRVIAFGERAGVQEFVANVIGSVDLQARLFRLGLRPRFPVYRFTMPAEQALRVGMELAKLLPALEITEEAAGGRTGAADLERIDRLSRGVSRPTDHEYWLMQRRLRLAKVREGQRIAAYAYGGAGQCGPAAGATSEAALAALGWALQFAAEA
ncbi:MAG: GNAT family N-acetyltransferase, partial [Acidobacteriota bacterium]